MHSEHACHNQTVRFRRSELVGRADDTAFERRLGEAIAWCEGRADAEEPRTSLRDPGLVPHVLQTTTRSATVHHVVSVRSYWLQTRDGRKPRMIGSHGDLGGGRLLVYFPDEELNDGAAEAESKGFFDAHDAPPWDTWIGLFDDGRDSECLVSWVPPELVAIAQAGIAVNPVECIRWLNDARVPVADELRRRGVLA